MTPNVGKTDKTIRLLVAVIILAAGAYSEAGGDCWPSCL